MSKVVVISSDAMVGEDLDYFKTLPNYRKYIQGGTEIRNVSSIYPSVTFPAHVTMMTGMYPDRHGVFSNMQLIPGSDPTPWQWNYDVMKCADIFKAAKAVGKTTAAVLWPVTAFNPSIDYHIADYWAQSEAETNIDAFRRAGASEEVIKIIQKNEHLYKGVEREHPQRDEFGMACAADIIREFSPDLLLVHPANIDAVRHANGTFGKHLKPALDDLDRWLGTIGKAIEDNGTIEETNIFIVSDHGQQDVVRNVEINVLLTEKGFIHVDEKGRITDWSAYCLSNGMSAVIFLKDKNNKELYDSVYSYLQELLKRGVYGFSKVYTEKQSRIEEHFGGDFSFVLETDDYSAFGDFCTGSIVRELTNSDYRFGRATHGYLPNKGPQPILLAKGPQIRENLFLSGNHIVNEAPTYAYILGLNMGITDGKAIIEMLK